LKFDGVADKFRDGLAWVKIGKNLGYIDKTGKLVVPAQYDYPRNNTKGIADEIVSRCNSFRCFVADSNFDRGLAIVVTALSSYMQ
jgi:WG containing repeat